MKAKKRMLDGKCFNIEDLNTPELYMVWTVADGVDDSAKEAPTHQGDVYRIVEAEHRPSMGGYLLSFYNRYGDIDQAWEGCFLHVVFYERLRSKYLKHALPPVNKAFAVHKKPAPKARKAASKPKKGRRYKNILSLEDLKALARGSEGKS